MIFIIINILHYKISLVYFRNQTIHKICQNIESKSIQLLPHPNINRRPLHIINNINIFHPLPQKPKSRSINSNSTIYRFIKKMLKWNPTMINYLRSIQMNLLLLFQNKDKSVGKHFRLTLFICDEFCIQRSQ